MLDSVVLKIEKFYKQNVYSRADDNGNLYYFSEKDFEGLEKENYPFVSSLGLKLSGCFYYYHNFKPGRIVIFDHGMGGGHRSYMKEIELLARAGYLVFTYDHTGCMESEGESTGGFVQSLIDLNDAIFALKSDENYKNFDFSVVGHSWGAFATLNIAKYHPDVKHLIAMSGFISVSEILKQYFGGVLSFAYDKIYSSTLNECPDFVKVNAIDSLASTDANVLIIHSKDDKTVSYKRNFLALKNALSDMPNVEFLTVDKKGHNPNYTVEASRYTAKTLKIYKKYLKKKLLNTEIEKSAFKDKFDWNKMTEQDFRVWEKIIKTLEK